MRGTDALPIAAAATDRVCLRCHDGRTARAERHPVGRPIPSATSTLPGGWPAEGGRLGCLTCHDLQPTAGHEKTPSRQRDNPNFLRGGQPASLLTFCNTCHADNEQEARHNPHRMLTAGGEIDQQACLFCHTRTFKPADLERRTGRRNLKAGGLMLCIGCHTQHVDYFEPGHIGAQVPPSIIAQMTVDRAAPDPPASSGDAEALPGVGVGHVRLPLGPQDVVVCSTCHNPHQEGVFRAGSPLDLGAIPATRDRQRDVAVRLGASLCYECHGK
jgi:hypothetical protein